VSSIAGKDARTLAGPAADVAGGIQRRDQGLADQAHEAARLERNAAVVLDNVGNADAAPPGDYG
jgi:hypothetical protein